MRPPSGRQYELVHGEQRAVVVEVGAGLRSYAVAGRDVVDGYGRDDLCDGGRGQLLLPWPNRIAGGRYDFGGAAMQLPLNEVELGNAIHGLARWMPWSLVTANGEGVSLSLDLPAQPGYPFMLALTADYRLGADGLIVRVTAQNSGDEPCPFGAGAHPFLHIDTGDLVDDALLNVPAGAILQTDDRSIPTGGVVPVEGTAFDFRTPKRIASLRLDTAYTQLEQDGDGNVRITLAAPSGERDVTVWMDSTHAFAMLFTGDTLADAGRRRRSVAIEPMTCAPDAFNSGLGLRVLQPGEQCTSVWGITVSTHG